MDKKWWDMRLNSRVKKSSRNFFDDKWNKKNQKRE